MLALKKQYVYEIKAQRKSKEPGADPEYFERRLDELNKRIKEIRDKYQPQIDQIESCRAQELQQIYKEYNF